MMTPVAQKWLSIGIVAAFALIVVATDGMRPLGTVAGLEPMRIVNIVFTLALAMTGPLVWARSSSRFRHVTWLRHAVIGWTHRLAGLAYLPLILLWDFLYESAAEGGGETPWMEAINKPLLIALLLSAPVLFFKRPRALMRHYAMVKYLHIGAATLYVLKFFAEPLLGGKLG